MLVSVEQYIIVLIYIPPDFSLLNILGKRFQFPKIKLSEQLLR